MYYTFRFSLTFHFHRLHFSLDNQSLPKMETSAISKNKIEVEQIQIAIQQLIESQQSSATEPPITLSDEEHQLLDKLLSQVIIFSKYYVSIFLTCLFCYVVLIF